MDEYLRIYQRECIENILDKLDLGAKNVSVTMTTGSGISTIMIFLADALVNLYYDRCLVVFNSKSECEQTILNMQEFGVSKAIECITVNELLNEQDKLCKYCLLGDLSLSDIKQITEAIKDKEVITVSVFSLLHVDIEEMTKEQRRIAAYTEAFAPRAIMYETKVITDIRDIEAADETEKAALQNKISADLSKLEIKLEELLRERDIIKEYHNRLKMYKEDVRTDIELIELRLKEDLDDEDREKASEELNKHLKECEEVEARLEKCVEPLKMKEAQIDELQLMIGFLEI